MILRQQPTVSPSTRGLFLALAFTTLAPASIAWGAGTFYVDNSNSACSNSGPGTQSNPYCTISAAVAAHNGPGTTINVMPGLYREQVTVPSSGASGSPFVIQGTGPGVVVDGSDDFSSPAKWLPISGDVWVAASVTWSPKQVFADGRRLTASTVVDPATLSAGGFLWVSGAGLYVNAGGGNPGTHQTLVGHRKYAFYLPARSWVTIDGFSITRTEDKGIYANTGSNNTTISHNTTTFSNGYGIQVIGSSGVVVSSNVSSDNGYHGIGLTAGVTGSTVQDNESFRNFYAPARQANGIYVRSSSGNAFLRNRLHDNQDTGLDLGSSSNNNVCVQNRSWRNGDHGYDHLTSTGNTHVGDVAWGNYKDGFSIEGTSYATTLNDCIAVDNGLTTNEFDLWVDLASTPGFVSNDNIFWNGTSQAPVKYISTLYPTIAAYSAVSGQDTRSIQADPLFMDAPGGNFHLLRGSPAIDSGNSSPPQWPSADAEGSARFDDPSTPNTGLGSITYADRGALEYVEAGLPPLAALSVTPSSGFAPHTATADASGSSDPDGSIVAYWFDFGDGSKTGPQSQPTASHTFAAGVWTVTVTAADNAWNCASASGTVTVTKVDRPPTLFAPGAVAGAEGSRVTISVSASDPDADAITSLTANLSTLPAGNNGVFVAGTGNTSGTLTWTPTFQDAGTYTVTFTAWSTLSASATTAITVANVDQPPIVQSPRSVSVLPGLMLTVKVTAYDPDAQNITSLTADLSGLPAGNNASFLVNATNTSGVLTWTPAPQDAKRYAVIFTATNALKGTSRTVIQVTRNAGAAGSGSNGGSNSLQLDQNYPNPFNPETRISFSIPVVGRIRLGVFGVDGRLIAELIDDIVEAGPHEITWAGFDSNGRPASSGVYYCRLEAGGQVALRAMAILR